MVEFSEGIPWKNELIPPSNYNTEISSKLDRIVMKCLAYNPDERYQNASELLADINDCFFDFKCYFERDIKLNRAVKKAFRLAKYENKLKEARLILKEHNMENMLDDNFFTDYHFKNYAQKTVTLRNISELIIK